jgi:hypothetical protein
LRQENFELRRANEAEGLSDAVFELVVSQVRSQVAISSITTRINGSCPVGWCFA